MKNDRPPSLHGDRPPSASASKLPVVAFSHLRWSSGYQRPQHLLSRLATSHEVLYVEEPRHINGEARFEVAHPCPGVTVLTPLTAVQSPGFHDDQVAILQTLLERALSDRGICSFVAWFCTPMALPLIANYESTLIIYDCFDDLAAVKSAPRQLRQRELALMRHAAVVFAGNPTLFLAKQTCHPNVVLLLSAVDARDFASHHGTTDRGGELEAAYLPRLKPRPRLGFVGVIDERVDLQLIEAIADSRPHWQIVMIGPIVGIDPNALPCRANIAWLGEQDYRRLPEVIAGWTVALLPYAVDDSTHFMSPTETLAYMAAGKPIVSTPIQDIQSRFCDVVVIEEDYEVFIRACDQAIEETDEEEAARAEAMSLIVARYSWDNTATRVGHELDHLLGSSEILPPPSGDHDGPRAEVFSLRPHHKTASQLFE